ncbi:MAG: flagellar protein FlgN [Deltaproteobacteria bacterium]|jgi:flagellar biosynthesis/type III secretory pathway chaperone|nr:flagellar protein FlgN [Deltaproteobacteria bacterium]
MFARIHGNLHRQFKALELLQALLEEEYELLRHRDTDAVTGLEFSIHQLLRQITQERLELKTVIQGASIREYAAMLPEEDGAAVVRLCSLIDALEQRSSRQASRNAELSLALLDQSQNLLSCLYEQIAPKRQGTYGAGGKYREERPVAVLISGRL